MDPIFASLLVALFSMILFSIYRYASSKNIWKEAGIPYTSEIRAIFGLCKTFYKPIHQVAIENYNNEKKKGKIHGTYLLGSPQLSVSDPELIKQILVKDFQNFMDRLSFKTGDNRIDSVMSVATGETWKRIRTVVSPAFSTGKLKKMTDTILECADTLTKNIEEAASSGEPNIDIKKFFNAFTMDVIASTSFGVKVDSHNNPDNTFTLAGRDIFKKSNQIKTTFFILFNKLAKILRIKPNIFTGFFAEVAKKLAEERRTSGDKRNDFLQLLVDALESNDQEQKKQTNGVHETDKQEEEDLDELNCDAKIFNENKRDTFRKVLKNEDEVISQCILLFLAGFETIATSIALAVYELAINQDVQETLIQEIDDMMENQKEDKLTYDFVQGLKYLEAVVNETFRKYPAAVQLQRLSVVDCTIGEGDNQIKIPKGTAIIIPSFGMHRDPEYFPDPEKFDPRRFSPEAKATINPYVYTPFGVGPRNCIAMRFAIFEVKLCIAQLLRHFRFHTCEKTEIPLKLPNAIGSFIVKDMFLAVEKRHS